MLIRVCFKCEEYITIFENFGGKNRETRFDAAHNRHPLMTMPKSTDMGGVSHNNFKNVDKVFDNSIR